MSVSPPPAWPDERLSAGAARLASRHQGHFSVETVQQLLTDSYRLLAENARVRTHLVVLAERLTAERLDALAHTQAPGTGAAVCCSCAGTTPDARRWPPPSWPTGRASA
ncbi:three-helix bundle dimerization domain-containing protein [Streptomyces sp. NPDC056930]|uniref:three-helix bundle dimerization domain-containing protein n=1 Tax=Streptomyces sp. NPDC056930 TaxID=3345967 RepID=UPI003644C2FE